MLAIGRSEESQVVEGHELSARRLPLERDEELAKDGKQQKVSRQQAEIVLNP